MKLIAEDKEEKDAADKARAESGEAAVDAVIAGMILYFYMEKMKQDRLDSLSDT